LSKHTRRQRILNSSSLWRFSSLHFAMAGSSTSEASHASLSSVHVPPKSKMSSISSLVGGSLSGITTAILTQPLDVLRTEMQRPCRGKTKPHLSTRMALHHIVETRGWTGLWSGMVPTVLRVGLGMGESLP
jgi:hypothetical protein